MDINQIKNKLASLQGQTKQKNLIWKPKPGSQIIRIVPYKHRPDNPFLELYFYYDVTKRTTLSPITNGEPDPINEFAQELRSAGDTESYRLAKKLEPKMRTYVPIIVRGQESEGIKFWGFGKTVYEEILKTMLDDDWGDITNPKTGRDLIVEFEKAQGPGTYPSTTIRFKPTQTPVTKDKDVLELITNMPNIDDIWQQPTYESLKEALVRYMDNSEEDEETETPSASETTTVTDAAAELFGETGTVTDEPSKDTPAATAVDDVDAVFENLFD